MLSNGIEIEKAKINDYFNEYYYSALDIFNKYKRYGFPWLVGYQELPDYLFQIYELFEMVLAQGHDPKIAKARNGKWQ